MENHNYQKVRELIADNDINEAFNILEQVASLKEQRIYQNELINHRSTYNKLRSERRLGVISFDEENRQYAKIKQALLEINEELLQRQINSINDRTKSIQIRLNGNYESFSKEDEMNLRNLIINTLNLNEEAIQISRIIRSSIIVVIKVFYQQNRDIVRELQKELKFGKLQLISREYLRNFRIINISYFDGVDQNTVQSVLSKDIRNLERIIEHLKIDLDSILSAIRDNLTKNIGIIESLEQMISLYKQMIDIYKFFENRVEGLPYNEYILNKLNLVYTQSQLFNTISSKFYDFSFRYFQEDLNSGFDENNNLLWDLLKKYRE